MDPAPYRERRHGGAWGLEDSAWELLGLWMRCGESGGGGAHPSLQDAGRKRRGGDAPHGVEPRTSRVRAVGVEVAQRWVAGTEKS